MLTGMVRVPLSPEQVKAGQRLGNGWHVNLMPSSVLKELPIGWEGRVSKTTYGVLTVTIPSPRDLIAPKLRRGEPRDLKHAAWAKQLNLIES